MARANALQAKTSHGADADAARVRALAAYKDFLTLWKDADPDIPILMQVKAEYAKLQWPSRVGESLPRPTIHPESRLWFFPKASLIPSLFSRARCKIAVLNWGQLTCDHVHEFGIRNCFAGGMGSITLEWKLPGGLAWLTVCVVLRGDGRC